VEGKPGTTRGLSLLPVETVLKAPKTTTLTRFSWQDTEGTGYEIHMGQTTRKNGEPLFHVWQRNSVSCEDQDGCVADNFRIMGTYIHGLFDTPGITSRWLSSIGLGNVEVSKTHGLAARDKQYDLLADHFENNINISDIAKNAGVNL